MKKIDLVILCGGLGSRLNSITKKTPKPLIKISGVPFIQYLLNFYCSYPFIENIFLLTSYKSEKFYKKFNNKLINCKKIKCLKEKEPLGTMGALFNLKNKAIKDFLLINGDSYINYNIEEFLKKNKNTILLCKNKNYQENKKLSQLSVEKNTGKIIFKKNNNTYMNAGVYFFKKKILSKIKKKNTSLEQNLIPYLIKKKNLFGYKSEGYFIDIGIKKNLIKAKKDFKFIFKKPAIFLDRDGVINEDRKYVHTKTKFKFVKQTLNKINIKNKNFYKFIITNQSGIGRGYYSEKKFINFQKWVNRRLYLEEKIIINDVKYCPHHPTKAKFKYKIKCKCRKPQNFLIQEVFKNWMIDHKKSIMVGDKISDKACADKSKIKFYYIDQFLNQ